jgi:tetratricopeptide (TPR) repeat protein
MRTMKSKALLALAFVAGAAVARADGLADARAATDARRYADALAIYEPLLRASPTNADLLIEIARVYGFADRHREAVATYRRVLEAAPARRDDVLPSLAWQTLWAGDASGARALFVEARASAAPGPAARAELLRGEGEAAAALGDVDGALDTWRAAADLVPHDRGLPRRIARALNDRGRHAEAAAQFARLDDGSDAGLRLEHARTRRWAGDDAGAYALLAGRDEPDAVWLRDWRLARDAVKSSALASVEHATDRDQLDATAVALSAGRWLASALHGEVGTRSVHLSDPAGEADVRRLSARLAARVGAIDAAGGLWLPSLRIDANAADGGWHPVTGALALRWLPADLWRVGAEFGREVIETPTAVAKRITADTAALSIEHRLAPRWTVAGSLARLAFSDDNERTRLHLRAAYLVRGHAPRLEAGVDAMAFDSSRPASFAAVPPPGTTRPMGYWNPRRYQEARAWLALEGDAQPWEWQLRLGLATARETDGDGNRSRAQPHLIEAALAHDLGPGLRLRLVAGASGAGFGVGGSGYWRRYLGFSVAGWF